MPTDDEFKNQRHELNRRDFLRTSLTGGVAMAAIPALAASEQTDFPSLAPTKVQSFEFDEAAIADLQKGMSSGKETARSITQKYLARIAAIDKADNAGDADTADLFTAVSRTLDQALWFLEAHVQA